MSPVLDGVRIAPLDPDRAENFGQVGGSNTARQLLRHHAAQLPPALAAALRRKRNDPRSTAIDKNEAEDYIRDLYERAREPIPEDSKITGMAVRGEEDDPDSQVLTFTFLTPGGRSAKGFVPYRDLPKSVAAGDEATRIADLKEAGLPWTPSDAALAAAGIAGTGVAAPGDTSEIDELKARVESLDTENDTLVDERDAALKERDERDAKLRELEERLAAVEAQAPDSPPQTPGSGEPDTAAAGDAPSDADEPATAAGDRPDEPWEGYDAAKAQDVRQKIRESGDRALAQAVVDYETRADGGQNRSTVISAANELLDHAPASD